MTNGPALGFATVVQVAWGLAAVVTVVLIAATIVLLMAEINARRLGRARVLSELRQKRLVWALAVAVLVLAILTFVGLALGA